MPSSAPPEVDACAGRQGRASALPPAERRAAIAAATLRLLREHGTAVTTKQIAEAAGVAEGTIFRVFADKDEVVRAAVDLAYDPAPTEAALAAIDRSQPLEAQLADAAAVVQARLAELWRLLAVVGEQAAGQRPPADLPGLADLFEPFSDRLRAEPQQAARQLRALTLAVTHPALFPDAPMPPAEIAALLLDGIRRPA